MPCSPGCKNKQVCDLLSHLERFLETSGLKILSLSSGPFHCVENQLVEANAMEEEKMERQRQSIPDDVIGPCVHLKLVNGLCTPAL